MISAIEAGKLVAASKTNVDRILTIIDPEIIKLATAGKRAYACYVPTMYESLPECDVLYAKLSPLQAGVAEKLREFGYNVSHGRDGVGYVPMSHQDDNGNGPKYFNVCLTIKW